MQPDDVGQLLRFDWLPMATDGAVGEPVSAESGQRVRMPPPLIDGLQISGMMNEGVALLATGDYPGHCEGESRIQWQRYKPGDEAVAQNIDNATQKQYTATAEDCGKMLKVLYTPIRRDGTIGKQRSAVTSAVIGQGWPQLIDGSIIGAALSLSLFVTLLCILFRSAALTILKRSDTLCHSPQCFLSLSLILLVTL